VQNATASFNDNNVIYIVNIDRQKAGEDTISMTLAKLYTKCL